MSNPGKKNENLFKIVLPVVTAFVAFAVQWGVVTTKLSIFEAVLEKQDAVLMQVQKDVSFIKGKMDK